MYPGKGAGSPNGGQDSLRFLSWTKKCTPWPRGLSTNVDDVGSLPHQFLATSHRRFPAAQAIYLEPLCVLVKYNKGSAAHHHQQDSRAADLEAMN